MDILLDLKPVGDAALLYFNRFFPLLAPQLLFRSALPLIKLLHKFSEFTHLLLQLLLLFFILPHPFRMLILLLLP